MTTGHRPVRPRWTSTFRERVIFCWGIRWIIPLLAIPLTPRPIIEDVVPESSVGSPVGEPVAVALDGMPDLSREGPFDVHQDALESGTTSQVLDSLPGCQYRMTSYDDDADRSDLNLAYGLHLHDPRLLEYVGAPESARLLSRTPEYWMHHWGRDRAMSAALQLQHDAGLILSNLQVLEYDGRHTTWLSWGCGVRRVPRAFLGPCRRPHAMLA